MKNHAHLIILKFQWNTEEYGLQLILLSQNLLIDMLFWQDMLKLRKLVRAINIRFLRLIFQFCKKYLFHRSRRKLRLQISIFNYYSSFWRSLLNLIIILLRYCVMYHKFRKHQLHGLFIIFYKIFFDNKILLPASFP